MLQGRRRYLVLLLIFLLIVAVGVFAWFTSPTYIYYYRLVDDQTLALGIDSGNKGNRLSGLVEAPDSVTVTVVALELTIGASGVGATPAEVDAHLSEPLGNRTVIDGKTGQPIERVACPPPHVSSEPCNQPPATPFTNR